MMYFLDNLRNNFDFLIRKNVKFSRKNYKEDFADLSKLFENIQVKEVYELLNKKYELNLFFNLSERTLLENLYYLNLFNKYLFPKEATNMSVLDIGSKNWSYVKSEYLFFQGYTKCLNLYGIELDAYRMNSKFYTRYEIAQYYKKDLPNTNYISGDFIEHNQKYDYIIWILPFITEYPLLRWGLPLKYFKPKEMLIHAFELLKQEGELLIINQGEDEYKVQKYLNSELDLPVEYYGEVEDNLKVFCKKRFACKVIKK